MLHLDALLTGAQAADYLGLSRQLIHRWRTLGHIHPDPASPAGHPLYRLGDLLVAERRTRRSGKSSRNPARAA